MISPFDLIIIGAGPAGYVAAIRAAQLGFKTALVEKSQSLGGTCLNVGCIPSKALLDSSEKYEAAGHHFAEHGVIVGGVKLDIKTMIARKDKVVKQLTGGIEMLMKKNKITVVNGWGTLRTPTSVHVETPEGPQVLEGKAILIAAGSVPVELPFAKFDGKTIVTSTEALSFESVPKSMIVIGAGVIGLELGSVWRRLGAEVTLVDVADRPLATLDAELGREAHKIFTAQGVKFELGAKVEAVTLVKNGAEVTLKTTDGKSKKLTAEKVLVAVGRKANTACLGLENVGVAADTRGVIQVDPVTYRTNIASIYAVGDCVPGPMLAHKGEEEGIACVERMAGIAGHVAYDCIPGVVYTAPEIATVGKTEDELKSAGIAYKVGKFNFRGNGRAIAMEAAQGFVKILADAGTDKVLGAHMVGPNVSELISEVVTVMEYGGSSEDIARTVHAHPTLAETVKEAALAVEGRALHS